MMQRMLLGVIVCFSTGVAHAQDVEDYPSAKVSYADFKGLIDEVESHRAERLIGLDVLEIAQDPNTIILDTRSAHRYDRIHVAGATHLIFDFNQVSLAEAIPSLDTRVLIYCNNNFDGNPVDFTPKVVTPASLLSNDGMRPEMEIVEENAQS